MNMSYIFGFIAGALVLAGSQYAAEVGLPIWIAAIAGVAIGYGFYNVAKGWDQ